jgi:predicted metalloprotease
MRWLGERRSDNVEDRRGMPVGRMAVGGGGAIILLIVGLLFGIDPRQLLNQVSMQTGGGGTATESQEGPVGAPNDSLGQFVSVVLAETEDVWTEEFRQLGREYRKPRIVLFTDQVQSACGMAGTAVGPFYCPDDERLYIDLAFYDLLRERLHAGGDFAEAYVIAHEVGHHVQKLLGVTDKVHAMREQMSEEEYNQLSVRLVLQADFYAGVWAHDTQRLRNIIEPGDIEEALNAASQIGDDKLQQESQGYVVPDAFTHGTSAQRVKWFKKGYETGDIRQGDTFNTPNL